MHGVSLKKNEPHSIFLLILLILLNKNPKVLFTTSQPEPKKAHFEMALEGFFVRLPLWTIYKMTRLCNAENQWAQWSKNICEGNRFTKIAW